jgi:hypothetical protein
VLHHGIITSLTAQEVLDLGRHVSLYDPEPFFLEFTVPSATIEAAVQLAGATNYDIIGRVGNGRIRKMFTFEQVEDHPYLLGSDPAWSVRFDNN